jgi:hypothetical protein
MYRRLIIVFLLSLPVYDLSAQIVTTDPALPTMGQLIKIYYDSSKDAGDLHNFTGDLYAHTGITVDGTDWKNVIGTWGNNSTQPKLKYLGNYLYELDISPDIKTYYSLSSGNAAKICLVFRNAAATLQTRPDIFLSVFSAGLNASITLPDRYSMVVELDGKIPIKASASLADSVTLYLNNKFLKSGKSNDLVTDTLVANQYGEFWVKAVAWDKPSFAVDSFFFYVRSLLVTESLPAGLNDGINYTGSNSVTLVLHAPYKNFVFATGDFTDWLAREKGYMKRTPDTQRYWVEINGLVPGKEYRFQYLIDTSLYIADPYSEKVLDPWNDPYITSETYPDLIQYPKETASGILSVLQTSQVPYSWKTTGFQPPAKSNLTIYELLIRDFVAKHDFKTLTDTLSYLDDLGVNAIELMPVCEFEGNLSWGYNPSFYFAPDKYYGPKNDMKEFVDSCHKRGIAVIMDIVLNHCMGQSPLVQLYLDHYGSDQIYMKTPNPWFNASSPNPVYKWGADFNHESSSTQKLVDRICAYWLTEYKVDGFRFDFTKGFTNTPGDGGSYDASRIAILKRMADQIWKVNSKAYVILEHFAPDTEEKELANYGMMLWGNGNPNYREAAKGFPSDLSYTTYAGRGWSVPNLVTYMESHDEERLMFSTLNDGASSGSYNTKTLQTALKRMELDAVFFLTIPGPKMIWQFGELGYDISINEEGRVSEKPIKWNYFSEPDRYRLFQIYKLLNNLRITQPVFAANDLTYELSSPLKRLQLNHSTLKVNVLGNFGITESSIQPAFQQSGKWYEYFTGDSITVVNVNDLVNLQPGEYRLYTSKRLANSELVTSVDDPASETEVQKITVYPNPFNKEILISISGGETSRQYKIDIFSAYGTPIRTITVPAGITQVIWDGKTSGGTDAAKGLYIIRVSPGQKYVAQKVIRK